MHKQWPPVLVYPCSLPHLLISVSGAGQTAGIHVLPLLTYAIALSQLEIGNVTH